MADQRKGEIIRECYDLRGAHAPIIALIRILLGEAREKNDEAPQEEVLRLQGEIRAYKTILTVFDKKMPPIPEKKL